MEDSYELRVFFRSVGGRSVASLRSVDDTAACISCLSGVKLLSFFMRLPKQIDQIFKLANEFHNDTSYPVGMTVDECWIYTGDVAGRTAYVS